MSWEFCVPFRIPRLHPDGHRFLVELALTSQRWVVDRITIKQARSLDLVYVDNHDPEYFDFFNIYFANAIMKLGRKLSLRQRVIATATVFFKRFYLKNSYCETDPFLVVAACCYVAAKAEECPVSLKVITTEARSLFSQEIYSIKCTPFDHTRIAEMEFYLVDDLESDLTVFHPYRTLMAICKPDLSSGGSTSLSSGAGTTPSTGNTGSMDTEPEEGEAEEGPSPGVGVGVDDGPRYWGTGEGQLELPEGGFQHAWFIINDTYRSNLCLIYPPHLIAIAALYLTVVFHPPSRQEITPHLSSSSRTSSRDPLSSAAALSAKSPGTKALPPDTILSFLASMNVSLPLVATIMQEIISLWALWDKYKEDATDATPSTSANASRSASSSPMKSQRATKVALSTPFASTTPTSLGKDENGDGFTPSDAGCSGEEAVITPAMLANMLVRMKEARIAALLQTGFNFEGAAGSTGIGKPANKMIERAQAAG